MADASQIEKEPHMQAHQTPITGSLVGFVVEW